MIPGTLDSLDDETWTQALNTNLMGHVWTTKYAVPHLRKS